MLQRSTEIQHHSNHVISTAQAIVAISILVAHLIYGLVVSPMIDQSNVWSLQRIFLQSSLFVFLHGMFVGVALKTLFDGIVTKLKAALPTLFLLLLIGILVGSWIVSGTLPLLVSYGFEWLTGDWFYLLVFILAAIFSLCTGSSWSTIATIGVVMVTVGQPAGAHLPALVGAIVGGAYFGDKLSPISDTTNIASVAAKIPVEQHIKGMLPTTIPAFVLAALIYWVLTLWFPITLEAQQSSVIADSQQAIVNNFQFSWLLFLPPALLFVASISGFGSISSVIISTLSALVLAAIFQSFFISEIIAIIWYGFQVDVLTPQIVTDSPLMAKALNRGGVLMLWDAVEIVVCAFLYIGMISAMQVLPIIVASLSRSQFTPPKLMMYTLVSSGLVNSMTSSQYANSFVVSEAYGPKFDELGVHRRYLSRSLEDTGTMLESVVPWTTTAVFVAGTLNVSVADYWSWQLFTWFNLVFAFYLASTLSVNSEDK